jgi:hypothetical protein
MRKNQSILLPVGYSQASIVQVKNTVLASNMLELKEIERYQRKHPSMDINTAGITWIAQNAARWRMNHPLVEV